MVALHFPQAARWFTADSLMALGCGRLFEGTPEQMWASLSKLAALPPETLVCSGHEYTLSNARFAVTVDPQNIALISRIAAVEAARDADRPTVPSTLADETGDQTVPARRPTRPSPGISGSKGATPATVFARIRSLKDAF